MLKSKSTLHLVVFLVPFILRSPRFPHWININAFVIFQIMLKSNKVTNLWLLARNWLR